ncbi:MAG: PSD1 and planctomycete cytochrome C domain-containing protein [Opitutales bacterium]|nr:PSD1 and planctomycete cytochrome C domain-containing protein [Opitutales bacterium]
MNQPAPLLCALLALALPAAGAEPVRFGRDVLPILSDNCFSCHGQDESHRKAKLRLDLREDALAKEAFVPGKPEVSALIERIITTDDDELMPPPESHKPRLTAAQVDILRRWIAEGAVWGRHWAFEAPEQAAVTGHPVDDFVGRKLAAEGLKPAAEAPRHTLLRRLSFDLTGLPPTEAETNAFLADKSPDAYERAVDRLLASPHYGERMAMWWLDAARYADTDGFQSDATRNNWPWRDWVVDAFNRNTPYDRFTLEQFAGDLLPDATAEQKLATCFHRNHMTNGEGGRDPEESRVDYVLDRVNTMGTTWLGLTLGCAQCHTHKFDPVTIHDYYSLTAFFNSIDEDGKAGGAAKPYLPFQSPHSARALREVQALIDAAQPAEKAARQAAEAPFATWLSEARKKLAATHVSWTTLRADALETAEGTALRQEADLAVQASGPHPKQDEYRFMASPRGRRITGLRLEVLPHPTHTGGGLGRGKDGEFLLTDLKAQVRTKGNSLIRDIALDSAVADFTADKKKNGNYGDVKDTLDDDPRNGWTTIGADKTKPHHAVYRLAEPLTLGPDEELIIELRQRSTLGDRNLGRFRLAVTDEAGPAVALIGATPFEQLAAVKAEPDAKLRARLFDQFLADHRPYRDARAALDRAMRDQADVKARAGKVNVMVLAERKQPRDTFVLVRGVWDKHGDKVTPDVPKALTPWPADAPRDRLGLARWLTAPANPLAGRVAVNHLWQMLFGQGIVRTTEDFGLQGESPSHPELLDWLAVDLVKHGWDLKRTLKLIVMSRTYRQDSAVSAALLAKDPENRLLGRGARFRLPSWMIRDAALRSAGLFNPVLGGPPVRPYQPDGVWEELFMGRFKYEASEGPAQYRRTLYAFWRRSIAPTFLFDSAQRRSCEVRTGRTNTPLQALTLQNDATYLESSQAIAAELLREGGDATRIQSLFRRVLSREANDQEAALLGRTLMKARDHYRAQPAAAAQFLRVGQRTHAKGADLSELAAWTVVASLTLNLDEAITHE